MALRSARVLPVVALLVLPLANGAIADALRSTGRRMVTAILDYSARLRAIDVRLNGAAAIPVMALLCFAAMQSPAIAARTEFPPDEFPVAAATELAKLPAGARVLAPDKYGGYLIYRFGGGRKVFMDGRSDFYGTEFMKEYIRLIQVRPGWRKLLKDYGFTHALVPVDFPLADALEHMGWKRLYADSTAVLLSGT
jgi:hypothetical protein